MYLLKIILNDIFGQKYLYFFHIIIFKCCFYQLLYILYPWRYISVRALRSHSQCASNHLYFRFLPPSLLTFNVLKSSSTSRCHLRLGLPLFFPPINLLFITLFWILSSLIISIWPIHLNLEDYNYNMYVCVNTPYIGLNKIGYTPTYSNYVTSKYRNINSADLSRM